MNKLGLQRILDAEGFKPDTYDLDGGLRPERLTLAREAGGWIVYYSERGVRTGKRQFESEAEACQDLLEQLRAEPMAKWDHRSRD